MENRIGYCYKTVDTAIEDVCKALESYNSEEHNKLITQLKTLRLMEVDSVNYHVSRDQKQIKILKNKLKKLENE